nr:hypothetical protein [Arthrobacter sp. MYb213]
MRVSAGQLLGDDFRHGIGRSDQADAEPVVVRDLTDSPDVLDIGGAMRVDDHAAAWTHAEARCLATGLVQGRVVVADQLIARTHADGNNHHVGIDQAFIGHQHAGDDCAAKLLAGGDFLREDSVVHRESGLLDQPAHGLAGPLIQLGAHQPFAAVNDYRFRTQRLGACGGFQPEQAATDGSDHRGAAQRGLQFLDLFGDGPDVFQRAVHEGVLVAGDWQRGCIGSGGKHQVVIAEGASIRGGHRALHAVDGHDLGIGFQADMRCFPELRVAEGEIDPGVGQRLGECHAVIGKVGFFG